MHQFTQLIELIELVGTIAFAVSGAMTGLRKGMDMFGVCMLGITAATCGGIIRDIMMGVTPPYIFTNPRFFVTSLITSLIIFSPRVRYHLFSNRKRYDMTLLITDSAGLGLFTYYGVEAAINAGFISNRSDRRNRVLPDMERRFANRMHFHYIRTCICHPHVLCLLSLEPAEGKGS